MENKEDFRREMRIMEEKSRKKIRIMAAVIILISMLISISSRTEAASLSASGTCGANVTWHLLSDGNMIIEGSGAMYNYEQGKAPWEAYRGSIQYISVNKGVTSIGTNAFYKCVALQEVWLSETIAVIGDRAFAECNSLVELMIPDNVTKLGLEALANCKSLKTVYLSKQISELYGTFEGCVSLESISLPDSLEIIGEKAFEGCSSLEEVRYIDKNVTTIGNCAFKDCSKLNSISLKGALGVAGIGERAFENCSSLTEFDMKYMKSLESIGAYAFAGCINLASSGTESAPVLKTIGDWAYAESGITSISLRSSVQTVGGGTFGGCNSLEQLIIYGQDTKLDDYVFVQGQNISKVKVKVNENNLGVIQMLQSRGISYETLSTSDISAGDNTVAVGEGPYRQINSDKLQFYNGQIMEARACVRGVDSISWDLEHVVGVDTTIRYGKKGTLWIKTGTLASTIIPKLTDTGIEWYEVYQHYLGDGEMMLCIAKNTPLLSVSTPVLTEGDSTTLKPTSSETASYSFTSSDNNIVTVTESGLITAKKAGTATINIYAGPTKDYTAGMTKISVTVKAKPVTSNTQNNTTTSGSGQSDGKPGASTGNTTTSGGGQPGNNSNGTQTNNTTGGSSGNKTPSDPIVQKIIASSRAVAYKSKPFYLKAKASGKGKLTYKSSNKKVAVINGAGKITVKNYGETKVTIRAAAKGNYKAASKIITIKVVPRKVSLKKVSSPKKRRLSAQWKTDKTVTGYEVLLSLKKNFKSQTFRRTFKKSKSKTTITGLKNKKIYYVKIRAYKKVGKKTYYGTWSSIKQTKIK